MTKKYYIYTYLLRFSRKNPARTFITLRNIIFVYCPCTPNIYISRSSFNSMNTKKEVYFFLIGLVILALVAVFYLTNGFFSEDDVRFSTQMGSLQSSLLAINDCEISVYGDDTYFPPSPFDPPLPPPNPHIYNEPEYVCRNFAVDFCKAVKPIPDIFECKVLLFDKHAINIIRVQGNDGKTWVCVVEPQTNNYYCIAEEEFKNIKFENWVKEKLCKEYYNFTEEECNKTVYNLELCSELYQRQENTACSESERGKLNLCIGDDGNSFWST